MNIRLATEVDIPALARVHVNSWRTAYRGIVADSFLDGMSYQRCEEGHRRRMGMPGTISLVAELPGVGIVGFLRGGPERSGDRKFAGEIYALYLLDQWRRRGIGTALVRRWAEELRRGSLNAALVWVLADNKNGVAFYEGLGGTFLREQKIEIGDQNLIERAYGWEDLQVLCGD